MKMALIIPSRERMEKKYELCDSIVKTVNDINNIALYFGIDDDDPTKEQVYEMVAKYPFIKVVIIPSIGKFQNLGILWNVCARASKEEIIAMIGDDMYFLTKNWDTKIIEEFTSPNCPPDNFKMVHCYDGRHGAKIAVNAFVHRVYMDINGYFMREEFPVDKIDIWLQQIFNSFGRLKYRGDIHIEHKHWSFRKSPIDGTVVRMRANNAEQVSINLWKQTLSERIKEAKKISQALKIPFDINVITNTFVNG